MGHAFNMETSGNRNTFFVRGVSFRQDEIEQVDEGMYALFEPEPTNPHDPNAIKVMVSTGNALLHIGYVPKELNKLVGRLIAEMDEGKDGGYWNTQVSRIIDDRNSKAVEVVFYADMVLPRQSSVTR
mgnify:CR=1 FL=1